MRKLILLTFISVSCMADEQFIPFEEFPALPPFDAEVIDITQPDNAYTYATALSKPDLRVELRLTNGEIMIIERIPVAVERYCDTVYWPFTGELPCT